MYDTLKFRKGIENLTKSEIENRVILLSSPNIIENEFGVSFSGKYQGLRTIINSQWIKIEGSISKFALNDNIATMTRRSTKEAVESLSDAFKIDFKGANMLRIDIGGNLIMFHPVQVYIPKLGELNYFRRLEQDNGIYYRNANKELAFYSKVRELKLKGYEVPEIYSEKSILRYEYRLMKRINEQLNRQEVNLKDLYNEDFYIKMLTLWGNSYTSIRKVQDLINMQPTTSSKVLERYIASIGINAIGEDKFLHLIKEWQIVGDIDKKQAYDLRKKVKSLSQVKNIHKSSALVEEMDKKVAAIVKYYR